VNVESTRHDRRIAPPLLLKFAAAGALSLGVVALLPRTVSGSGVVPPARMLFETAVLVGLICSAALFWGVRSDLRLPLKVAVYAVMFNVLVIGVKLWLAPKGFYDVNQIRNLTSGFEIDDSLAAVCGAALIFALYAAVYFVLYRVFRGRIAHLAEGDPIPRLPGGAVSRSGWSCSSLSGLAAAARSSSCSCLSLAGSTTSTSSSRRACRS
jgi:cytochrome bd-type quinol oxidase subunit 2